MCLNFDVPWSIVLYCIFVNQYPHLQNYILSLRALLIFTSVCAHYLCNVIPVTYVDEEA